VQIHLFTMVLGFSRRLFAKAYQPVVKVPRSRLEAGKFLP
jgi:hypothetical protein